MKLPNPYLLLCRGVVCVTIMLLLQSTDTKAQVKDEGFTRLRDALKRTHSKLCSSANLFTVKVIQGDIWGSGFIISKQDNKYTIVTNGHVLTDANKYIIQTHDGAKHQAQVLHRFDKERLNGDDLAILQFHSSNTYAVSKLSPIQKGQQVITFGFPLESETTPGEDYLCTKPVEISQNLPKPMQRGYQLGYFLTLPNGMSGGPLLNTQGQVVGMNGFGVPLIFVNPHIYLYQDGSRVDKTLGLPPDEALDLLSRSSWAIPSQRIIQLSSKFVKLSNNVNSKPAIILAPVKNQTVPQKNQPSILKSR